MTRCRRELRRQLNNYSQRDPANLSKRELEEMIAVAETAGVDLSGILRKERPKEQSRVTREEGEIYLPPPPPPPVPEACAADDEFLRILRRRGGEANDLLHGLLDPRKGCHLLCRRRGTSPLRGRHKSRLCPTRYSIFQRMCILHLAEPCVPASTRCTLRPSFRSEICG